MTSADFIISEARALLGTPYVHQGRQPGIGIDCIGVAIVIGRRLELCPPEFDITGYGREPANGMLCKLLDDHLPRCEIQPGCLLVFRWFREPQHCGIYTDTNTLIHSFASQGGCKEHTLDSKWHKRVVCAYDMREGLRDVG